MKLFVYGTLMWPEVMAAVTGRSIEGRSAVLNGVRRVRVRGEVYPALIPGDDTVEGVLFENLTELDLAALDCFEGAEYERLPVTVCCGTFAVEAAAYFASEAGLPLLEDCDWIPADLSPDQLRQFCADYKGWG